MIIKFTHFLNKIFNITHHEWPRVLFSITLKTLLQIVFIIWSTLLTATFLEKYHIVNLPVLYIFTSLAIIFWSLVFSFFIEEINKKRFLIWLSVTSVFVIAWTWIVLERSVLFFVLLIIFVSICLTQLNIILSNFIEELFSPLEAERTLPLIESSEPIWGIIWWALLAFWAERIPIESFFKILFFLLVCIMVLLSFTIILEKIPKLISASDIEDHSDSKFKNMIRGFSHIKWIKYLRWLVVVVFLHFSLFTLIWYQYTSALDKIVLHENEIESTYQGEYNSEIQHSNDTHSYASELAHWLWLWHILFSIWLFISQSFFTSRIMERFWIMNTMTIFPIALILPAFSMLSYFSVFTAISTKAFLEVFWWMHRAAYFSSFYALKTSIRDQVKEFLEWIVRPMWMLFGTIFLFVLSMFFHGSNLHSIISLVIFISIISMYIILRKLKARYTFMINKNIENESSVSSKLMAIEILAQKWHEWSEYILWEMLNHEKLPEIKEKIIEAIARIWSTQSIPDILNCLKDENQIVQYEAIKALVRYKNIWKNVFSQWFAKYRIINALETLILSTKSHELKSLALEVFTHIDNPTIIPFFISVLDASDDDIKADLIYICKYFDDVNIAYYIEKYLNSSNPNVKASVIISLWQFHQFRIKLTIILSSLLISKNKKEKIAAIYALWEIQWIHEVKTLNDILMNSKDSDIKIEAAIALAKIWDSSAVEHILQAILNKDKLFALWIKRRIKLASYYVKNHIKNLLIYEITQRINEIVAEFDTNILDDLSDKTLELLMHYYILIDEDREVARINYVLKKRK